MPTTLHFIDVGQGNMVFLQLSDGTRMLYDCNVTDENEDRVLGYLANVMGWGSRMNIFVNSHRDADHMRGITRLHQYFPIQKIWDSGVTGNTPNSSEYRDYMALRRSVGYVEIERRKRWTFGQSLVRVMNAKNEDIPDDANAQSIVIKVEHLDNGFKAIGSAMLTGDSDAQTWRYSVLPFYKVSDVKSDILLASHHGSLSFFDDPADDKHYYLDHLRGIAPAMTIVSVGDNSHGHPETKALEFYEQYSAGSNKGNKLKRTDHNGTIRVSLNDDGQWNLWDGQ